jgi:hypothetical protein
MLINHGLLKKSFDKHMRSLTIQYLDNLFLYFSDVLAYINDLEEEMHSFIDLRRDNLTIIYILYMFQGDKVIRVNIFKSLWFTRL